MTPDVPEFHKMPNMLDPTAWVQALVEGDYELVHVWLGGPNSDQAELKFKKRSPENVLNPPRSDVAALAKAERNRRLWRIGAWLTWALLAFTVVDALLWADLPGSLFRVAMACVIVGIAEGVFVPSTIDTAARCRVRLDRVQRDYDEAFARMLAEEQ